MIKFLIKVLINSPVYPHWLEHMKMNQGNKYILNNISGNVVEVGAGDGSRKIQIMRACPKIKSYIATDYSSWDDEFEKLGEANGMFKRITRGFMGRRERLGLDAVCSATKLPYKNETFDVHLSFEVLEHIDSPRDYFREASRVVKKRGKVMFCVPFMYREHKMDFYRYTGDFFETMGQDNDLKLIHKYSNTGYGTTSAVLTNQWLIRRIVEGPFLLRPVLLLASPFVFFFVNIFGWLIDLKPDGRFATRYHIAYQKN